jgi:hypothetical protein
LIDHRGDPADITGSISHQQFVALSRENGSAQAAELSIGLGMLAGPA